MFGENDDLTQRLSRVAEKLYDRRAHLGAPLSEDQISTFEDEHGIVLPDAYHEFLLMIGNGGDGPPYYGCAELGCAAKDMSPDQQFLWTALPDIDEPFPFTAPWIWENGDDSNEGTREETSHGSVYIGNDGCGQYWHLIVTGPERGNVWQFCGVGIVPTIPRRDYLQWYEDWLDGVENWWA